MSYLVEASLLANLGQHSALLVTIHHGVVHQLGQLLVGANQRRDGVDVGVVVNPMIVDGQIHGGVAQGIGQALMECVSYDSSGQPVTGSFMDYALPRATDIPNVTLANHPSPATTNPLGTKGCGEAGCAGSLSTVVNAVLNALSDLGVTHINMPLTPERVWQAIQQARKAA